MLDPRKPSSLLSYISNINWMHDFDVHELLHLNCKMHVEQGLKPWDGASIAV